MSYRTRNMQQPDTRKVPITISAPGPMLAVPHMLKQQNFDSTGQTVVNPGHVTLRVLPHSEVPLAPAPVSCGDLFPTQNQMRTNAYEHESDWTKHNIVASVAGLEKKLAQLDSEMRTAAPVEAPIHTVMGQVQDHARLLRKHSQLASDANSRHKDTTSLTHQICSQMNDTVESHATSLQKFEQDIRNLKTKQKSAVDLTHGICSALDQKHRSAVALTHDMYSTLDRNLREHTQKQKTAVGLMHEICSAFDKDLQGHAVQGADLRHDVSRLQQSNAIAGKLLTQILGMIGQHQEVVSKLQDGMPADQMTLLDAMCEAFEKTKGKMQTFEATQRDMQRIISEFKSGNLTSTATHDAQEMQKRIDKYVKLSEDMDAQLSRQQGKIREIDDAHQVALQKQQHRISELEHLHQTSLKKQQSKIQELEARIQDVSLQQLNSSQQASIARTTDRDVQLLRHELKHIHTLKKDVEAIQQGHDDMRLRDRAHADISRDIKLIKSQVSAVSDAQERNPSKSEMAEMNAKVQDLQRNQTLQDVRLDKTHMHIVDIRKKMET